jgi:hypothetical protein
MSFGWYISKFGSDPGAQGLMIRCQIQETSRPRQDLLGNDLDTAILEGKHVEKNVLLLGFELAPLLSMR